MTRLLALLRRELAAYFLTPLGWAVITLFLLVQGYGFYLLVELLCAPDAPHGAPMRLFFGGTFLFWVVQIVVIAAITMRLIAGERANGSLESLMTAPVSEAQVVAGKYLSALLFYVILWLPTALYAVLLWQVAKEPIDIGPLLASYLGTLTIGASFIAIGTLFSALARSQIVAALATFAAGALLVLIGPSGQFVDNPTLRAIIGHVDLFEHMDEFARGVVDSRRLVVYLSLTIFSLVGAVKALQRRKWVGA